MTMKANKARKTKTHSLNKKIREKTACDPSGKIVKL